MVLRVIFFQATFYGKSDFYGWLKMLSYMWNQVAIIDAVGWVTPEIIEIDIPQNKLCPLVAQAFQE